MPAIKTVSIEAKKMEGFKIEIKARGHTLYIDQPAAGGGTDFGPTPLEYLFFSLGGCIATIGHLIAKQKRYPVRGIQVRVEGELDTEVFQGKTTEGRAGFTSVRVFTNIDADMTHAEKENFLHEIDARCPISDNLFNNTPIEFVVE